MKRREELIILFVDDEPDILNSLSRFLRREPYKKFFAENALSALELLDNNTVDIIVSDLRMPGMNGLELINEVKKQKPDTVRMIVSGSQDIDQIIESINTGEVFRFIPKPVDPESFKKILNDAIEYYFLRIEREELFEEISLKNRQLTDANQTLQKMATDLKRSEEQIRSMNDAAQDAVFMLDENGTIIYRNIAAEIMFGYSRTEYCNQYFSDLFAADPSEITMKELVSHSPDHSGHGCENQVIQIEGIRHDGMRLPLEISKGCIHHESGAHSVLIARDITTRIEEEISRQHYENLQKALESQIERKLLQSPVPTTLQGIEISRLMLSSEHLDGDFTEFIAYNPQHVDLLIGDVMGHGIQPALVGAGIKSLFLKTVAQQRGCAESAPQLHQIVSRMHENCIHELIELGIFATLLFIRIDLGQKLFSIVDCGHNPLIFLPFSTCRCKLIKGTNLPMGMIEDEEYQETLFSIEKNDLLILYSDGITECRSPDGSMFGIERFSALLEQYAALSTEEIIEKVQQTLSDFCGCETFDDDVTCIIIRILDDNCKSHDGKAI
jgi:PAS domain S-box-containing protein